VAASCFIDSSLLPVLRNYRCRCVFNPTTHGHRKRRSSTDAPSTAKLQKNRERLAPLVLGALQAACEAAPPGQSGSLPGPHVGGVPAVALAKEAVLNAAGVGAYELHDYVEFSSWFQSTLLPVREQFHSVMQP